MSSRLAEMVDEEERRVLEEEEAAEGAHEDEQAAPEPATEPEQPADSGPSEQQLRAFEKENKRHEDALRKIMGDAFDVFAPCPTCEGVGLTPQGFEPPPEMKRGEGMDVCGNCAGYGAVLTGALVPPNDRTVCPACAGAGWTNQPRQIASPPAPPPGGGDRGPATVPHVQPGRDVAFEEEAARRGYMAVPLG